MCKSIHCHYIESYYGRRDTDFLCRLSRKIDCWSWSPTPLQLYSWQSSFRNLITERQKHRQHNYLSMWNPIEVSETHTLASCVWKQNVSHEDQEIHWRIDSRQTGGLVSPKGETESHDRKSPSSFCFVRGYSSLKINNVLHNIPSVNALKPFNWTF